MINESAATVSVERFGGKGAAAWKVWLPGTCTVPTEYTVALSKQLDRGGATSPTGAGGF